METTRSEVLATPVAVLVEEFGGPTRVCQESGIGIAHLWRIMNNKRNPNYQTRTRLAEAFGVRIDEVVYPADLETV